MIALFSLLGRGAGRVLVCPPVLALLLGLSGLALAACSQASAPLATPAPTGLLNTANPPSITPPAPTEPVDTAITPAPDTVTAPVITTEPCGYQWASRALPAESEGLQAALDRAGLGWFEAHAAAYGENCVTASGQVAAFTTMQTDFFLRAEVADLADEEALGAHIEGVLDVLRDFPPGTFPGPQSGYLRVEYHQGDQGRNLWFRVADAEQALAEGKHGAALLSELSAGD